MKLEKGKFTHAVFANDKKDLIRALWQDEATKQHYEYTMEIDLNNEIYQKLLETFTTSEISSMTEQQHKRSQAMYETFLKNVGVKYGLLYNPSALHPKEAFNIDHLFDLPNSNDGNDFLFNIKIKIFDLPQVANSNNKDLKKKLRESKTPIEALYIAGKFLYE
jgi:hypothetical protein